MATIWQNTFRFVAIAAIATWCISDPCFAQRGRGDGGGRGRGGDGGARPVGAQRSTSSGPAQIQSSQQNTQFRSSNGGGEFRSSDGRRDTGTFRRGESTSRPSQSNRTAQEGRSGKTQRSFYRGTTDRADESPRTADASRGEHRDNDWRNSVFRDDNVRERERNVRDRIHDNQDRIVNGRNIDRNRAEGTRQRLGFDNDDRFDHDRDRSNRYALDADRDDWSRIGDQIRDDWRRRDRNDLPFRPGWWDRYRNDRWPVYNPWGYSWWRDRPYYWWGWTPAGRLTSWLIFGWDRPRYWVYGYGPGSNIYYQGDYVYYDDQRYLPVADYYQQVYRLAHEIPAIDPKAAEQMEWASLGVFAVLRNANEGGTNQRTMQLAVNKDGVIAGTYYNPPNSTVRPLSGRVDDQNQRAAWAFADGDNGQIVFETSIFNLTRSETTMMVHFGPSTNQTEVWRLVRLEYSQNTTSNSAAASTPQNSLP